MKLSILLSLAAFPLLMSGQAATHKPAVWMGPPGVNNGKAFRDLFEHADEWKQTRSMVDGILYWDHLLEKQFSDDELRHWFAQLQAWKLGLMLEVGAIKEWGQTGDVTFNRDSPSWDRIQRLGGKIHAISMDEPLICARKKINKSDDYAAAETAKFIGLVRARFPDVLVGEIEPYPSIPVKDHFAWIENLNRRLREMKVRELDFYRLDVNWVNFTVQGWGSWREVRQLEQYCRDHHLPFSLIYWSANLPALQRLGRAGESTWYISIMNEAQDYALVGGQPDEYMIESWVGEPPRTVPETGEWTFTRSVRDLVTRFVQPPLPQKPVH